MKNRTRALAAILAVLLIGCLLGIAGYHYFGRGLQKHTVVSDTQRTQGHAGRLVDRLQLTKEQEAQLNVILEDSRRQIDAGRKELEFKMQAIRVKTNERIDAILNDEQRKKFQQFRSETKSHDRPANQGSGHGSH
jgi:Spy/CpxP family protein refolding chaperone